MTAHCQGQNNGCSAALMRRRAMLAIQGRWQDIFLRTHAILVVVTRRSELSLCKHTRAPSTLSDHDSPARERLVAARKDLRRQDVLSTRRTAKHLEHRRGSAWLLCCEQRAAATRAQTARFRRLGQAVVQPYALAAKLPAITRATPRNPTISTDKPVKPNPGTRAAMEDGPLNDEGLRRRPTRTQSGSRVDEYKRAPDLVQRRPCARTHQVRHVRREPARDRACGPSASRCRSGRGNCDDGCETIQ